MCNKKAGFTLIEMVIAIMIVAVGLAGVLAAFSTAVRGSSDPLIHKQMLAVAEEMLEEIQLKPYTPQSGGTISGCNRAASNDIGDYAGYNQPVCDIDGTPLPDLAGYMIEVDLQNVTLHGVPARKIVVTVTRSGRSVQVSAWRTDWAS